MTTPLCTDAPVTLIVFILCSWLCPNVLDGEGQQLLDHTDQSSLNVKVCSTITFKVPTFISEQCTGGRF